LTGPASYGYRKFITLLPYRKFITLFPYRKFTSLLPYRKFIVHNPKEGMGLQNQT
jgi:hypothetical protein